MGYKVMKTHRKSSKILSLIALTLALVMALTSTAFAADNTRYGTYSAPYTITRNGEVVLATYDEIRTDWNNDGCQLDTCFLTGESMLRRLRLTFNDAYDLYDFYQSAANASTVDAVMYAKFQYYGNLRAYLSDATYNQYFAPDGAAMLQNLKASSEYRNNASVRWLVDSQLRNLESYYAPALRRALAFFCNETILKNMNLAQLKSMAAAVLETPEYIQFHNTLFGHDCSTVESLMKAGYSLDYVARLYSNQAENAVKAIWPDYVDWMNEYWRANRAW